MVSESLTRSSWSTTATARDRLDIAVTALSALMVLGVALDARAHAVGNISFAEEGFFTPEHVFFYSAFLGIAATLGLATVGRRRAGANWVDAVPTGYGVGVLGVVLFGFGGFGDFLWHSTFGFEQGVEALTSPTHLLLATGGVLFLSSPLRSAWRRAEPPTGLALLPALLSAGLAFAIVGLFSAIVNPLTNPTAFGGSFGSRELGVATFVVFPSLLVGAGLLLARRFDLSPGALTLVFLFPGAITFATTPVAGPLVVSVLAAGLVADLLVQTLPLSGLGIRLFGVAVPLSFGAAYFGVAVFALGWLITWTVHVWTGAVVLSALAGLLLTYVAVPDTAPEVSV